jgi:hypothetical protein
MYDKKLREIRLLLDSIPGDIEENADSQHCFNLVEEAAISVLDSRFMDFEDGLLEEFLLDYLRVRQYEYGLINLDCPELVER